MRLYSSLIIVAAVSATKTLEEVYGKVDQVKSMVAKTRLIKTVSRDLEDTYKKHRSVDNCDFSLDILLVQDNTSSFDDNWKQMAEVQLDLMFAGLSSTHPNSKYAMMDFKDKPIPPFGIPATAENGGYHDYCVRLNADFSDDVEGLKNMYANNTCNGGGDPAESQFTALMAATQADFFTWDSNDYSTRLVVMITDAPPHFEGDTADTKGMIPFSGRFNEANPDTQCITEFYPSAAQVRQALNDKYAYLATLIYDPSWWNGLPSKSWKWFNSYINQTDAFINLSAADFSDFWTNLAQTIKYIEDLECVYETTVAPTEAPTMAPTMSPEPSSAVAVDTPIFLTMTEPECPPCPPDNECPPCGTPPPRPDECEETVLCDDGVYINIGFKPDNVDLKIDGKQIPL